MSNTSISLHSVVRVTHELATVPLDCDNPRGRSYQVYRIKIQTTDGDEIAVTCFSADETLQPIQPEVQS